MLRPLTLTLATLATLTSLAMAGAAALERGTGPGALLIGAGAVCIALGAHLLPALSRRNPAGWALWACCLIAVAYSHANFYAGQAAHAGQARAQAVTPSSAAQALQDELSSNTARPLAQVAQALAKTTAAQLQTADALRRCAHDCTRLQTQAARIAAQRQALETEHTAAQRAQAAREQLTAAAQQLDTARTTAAQNPVDAAIARILGLDSATTSLLTSTLQSMLIELLGALCWSLYLSTRPAQTQQTQQPTRNPRRPLFGPLIPTLRQHATRLLRSIPTPPRPPGAPIPAGVTHGPEGKPPKGKQ